MSATTSTDSTVDAQKWACYFCSLDAQVLFYRASVELKPELDAMFSDLYKKFDIGDPWCEILPNTYTESQISAIHDMYTSIYGRTDGRQLVHKVITETNVKELRAFVNCDECTTLDNECFERDSELEFNFVCHHTTNGESKRELKRESKCELKRESKCEPKPKQVKCHVIKCKGDFSILNGKMDDINLVFTHDGNILGKLQYEYRPTPDGNGGFRIEGEVYPLTEDEKVVARKFKAENFADLKIFNATDLKNCESFNDICVKYGWPMTKAARPTCVKSATE